eukprot:gnl/TRDRNA2_/TRDRNA2_36431_c0_seq1.p1 gnl/TRDRNA2_/TRDRNA2_36431_c0~~gnl/TRDRNA2_/TRDRNA2_36431_c0_seq1.p1  ORF type:complete len:395 (+),score=65.28 gnl/TRDRNA2_/TRDRNA2_36431_c0_seq1:88-1272(+)
MTIFGSPVLPFAAAAASYVAPWEGARSVSWLLSLYTVYACWRWYAKLSIIIDAVPYKVGEPPKAKAAKPTGRKSSGHAHDGREKRPSVSKSPRAAVRDPSGFHTPPGSPDTAPRSGGPSGGMEWAPFKSLPFGEQPGAPNAPYWVECDASVFDVRNIRYKQTKEKVPSDFCLYDCVGMDMVKDKCRIDDTIGHLPSGTLPASSAPWDASWGVPRVLVVNCQLPYEAGKLIGKHPENDAGCSVTNYFVLSQRASELLSKDRPTPSLNLLRRFVFEGKSTRESCPFKAIGRIEDLEKHEVPESFHGYNNKPVLVTKSAKVIKSHGGEVLQIDYDVRTWVVLARKMLKQYRHRAREAELEIGYLIEGRTDDELPEQLLGCFTLINMDMEAAKQISVM